MLLIGLTGSIATGKSTVSNILRVEPYSLTIIDADILARQVVEPGTTGYQKIVDYFASTTPDLLLPASECQGREDGLSGQGRPLNRPALGRRVFGDSAEKAKDRAALGRIVHPAVKWEMYKMILKCYLSGCWAVVLDIPLLFESGWEQICGTIMVVAVTDPAVQMQRLRQRDPHLSAEDASNRVSSQVDIREKAARCKRRGQGAGVVVWNDNGKEDLRREVDKVMVEVKQGSPRWWAWLLLLLPPAAASAAFYSFVRSTLIQRQWTEEKRREKAKL